MTIDKDTWKLSDALEDRLEALREKAKEAAAVERAGITSAEAQKKFNDLNKEKARLGTLVLEAREARDLIEMSVPLEARQAVGQAEIRLRVAQGELEARRRRVIACKTSIATLEKDADGSSAHDLLLKEERETLKDAVNAADDAALKVEQAKVTLAKAEQAAKPKRPK